VSADVVFLRGKDGNPVSDRERAAIMILLDSLLEAIVDQRLDDFRYSQVLIRKIYEISSQGNRQPSIEHTTREVSTDEINDLIEECLTHLGCVSDIDDVHTALRIRQRRAAKEVE
jgi:hypothetical protein